jgi:hypothetical protein
VAGFDRVVQLLADHGGGLSVRNARGQTPLGALEVRAETAPRQSTMVLRTLGATR